MVNESTVEQDIKRGTKMANRCKNLYETPWRLVKTITHYGTDIMNCLNGIVDDFWWIVRNTKDKIKNLFKEKTWYQKALNVPVLWWIAAVTLIEKTVKPVWRLAENAVTSTRNFGRNLKNTIFKVFSKKPVSDFSYSNLKLTQERLDNNSKISRFFNTNKLWTQNWWNRSKCKHKSKSSNKDKATKTPSTEQAKNSSSSAGNSEETWKKSNTINNLNIWTWSTHKSESKCKEVAISASSLSSTIDDISDIELSNKWESMLKYLNREHPEIKIEFDASTYNWHLYWAESGNKIVVWTKKKEDAPQILLHEISHVLEQDDAEWVKELKDTMKSLNEKYGKQLFSVSNNDKYDTKEKKTIEDVCEIIAMYARDDWSFEKHMKNLQSEKDKRLAKISESEAEHLKSLCENIISKLNVVKLYEDTPASAAA